METTLHSHMHATWYQYGTDMVKPYSCHIGITQEAYGCAICLLYGIHTAAIWQSHMPAT